MSIHDLKLGRRAIVQSLAAVGIALTAPATAAVKTVRGASWLEAAPEGARFLEREEATAALRRNPEMSLHERCHADPNLLAERWWVAGAWDIHTYDADRWGPRGAGPRVGRLELARDGYYVWDHAPEWVNPRGRWGMTHEGGSRFPLFFEHRYGSGFVGYLFGREEHFATSSPDMPVEFFWKEEVRSGERRDFLVARSFRGADNLHWAPSDRERPWLA
jgi:hypothetical protein